MLNLIKRIAKRFSAHNMMVTSAGVAFYGLLALAPAMVATVSVYGLVTCDPSQIEEQVDELLPNLGGSGKEVLIGMLQDSTGATEGGCDLVDDDAGLIQTIREIVTTVFGVVLALWSSSGAVNKLLQTISMAYESIEERPGWKVRLMAYGFTASLITGVVLLLATFAVLPAVIDSLPLSEVGRQAVNIGRFPLIAALYAGALTILYRYAPYREDGRRTPWWNPGAVVGTLLFLVLAVGLTLYSQFAGTMPASYSVIGSVAALMIFLQMAAISVLVGAETNAEIEGIPVPGLDDDEATSTVPARRPPAEPAQPVSFGKALAGVAALILFGRGSGD